MSTTTNSVSGASTTTQPTPTNKNGMLDQNAFLKLMVAQMQHQDPLAPTDSAQMMSQLAQFTSVEQLNNVSSTLSSLQKNQDFAGSVALIGHNVTYLDPDGNSKSGVVSAVTPSTNGTELTIGSDQVDSGDVVKVQ